MEGDDGLAAARGDGVGDLTGGGLGGHHQPGRDRILALLAELAGVVHEPDLALDKARGDVGDRDAVGEEIVDQGLAEPAHRELAGHVGRRAGQPHEAVDAADGCEAPPGRRERREAGLRGPDHAEDVDLEDLAVILQRELGEGGGDGDPRVGDGHVDAPEALLSPGDGALEIAVDPHVPGHREGPAPQPLDLEGELLEPVQAPRQDDHIEATPRVLEAERVAYPGRGPGDERYRRCHRFTLAKRPAWGVAKVAGCWYRLSAAGALASTGRAKFR